MACTDRNDMLVSAKGLAVQVDERVCGDAPPLSGLLPGVFYAQHLPSIVAAHALDARQGQMVIDLCAAPGGKTSAICSLMATVQQSAPPGDRW